MKKIIALVIVAIMMLQTSAIFAEEITAYNFKPELDGVISEGEYPAESTMRVDKALVDSRQKVTFKGYENYMPADLYYDMSYAWDEEYLYIALDVVDKTPVKAPHWDLTGTNGGNGRCDGLQINVFVDQDFGKWFMVTLAEDGTVYTCGNYNEFPKANDRQNFSPYCPGKGTWTETGYVIEVALPWSMIEQGNHFADHSDGEAKWVDDHYIIPWVSAGVEVEEGLEMAISMCCQDVDADQNRGRYSNDVQHGNADPDGIRDFVVLAGEKPAADTGSDDQGTTDTGADTGADAGEDAAQTFDFGVIALVAAVVSAAAMLLKKKR